MVQSPGSAIEILNRPFASKPVLVSNIEIVESVFSESEIENKSSELLIREVSQAYESNNDC